MVEENASDDEATEEQNESDGNAADDIDLLAEIVDEQRSEDLNVEFVVAFAVVAFVEDDGDEDGLDDADAAAVAAAVDDGANQAEYSLVAWYAAFELNFCFVDSFDYCPCDAFDACSESAAVFDTFGSDLADHTYSCY